MKKIVSLMLSLVLLFTFPCTAFAAGIVTNQEEYSTTVKWVSDETKFDELFPDALHSPDATQVLECSATRSASSSGGENQYVYSFDIDGAGKIDPISVSGALETCTLNGHMIQMGVLYGTQIINDVLCSVYAVVQKSESDNKMYAGVTVVPTGTSSLDDYIYFYLGDPIVTKDMLPQWVFEDDSKVAMYTNQAEASAAASYSGYTLKGSSPSSGSIGTAYQLVEFYHNTSYNRSCVGVYSNAELVENSMSSFGLASTIVSSLKIGMKANASYAPYIDCVHNIPEDADTGEELFNTDFISDVISIVSDIFEIGSVYTTPLETLLEALANSNRVDISISNAGTNTSVLFEYTTNLLYMEDVKFDDAPMPVTFQLDSATSSNGYFSAYSEIEYYTVIIPDDPNALPMFYTTPGGSATTSSYKIYVTN